MRCFRLHLLASVIAIVVVHDATGREMPKDVKAALEKADQWELFSLDPSVLNIEGEPEKYPPKDAFQGWKVLGKTTIKDADKRKELLALLVKGAADDKAQGIRCFEPRHGIRMTIDGKTIDLVICFHCMQAYVYTGEKKMGYFLTGDAPQAALNKVLTDAKVPLPKAD
jgi:hypothetical protein